MVLPSACMAEYLGAHLVIHAAPSSALITQCGLAPPQLQALAEDDDDSYANSSWANPKSLKSHFAGVQSVRLPK